jgi:hypothetical protein
MPLRDRRERDAGAAVVAHRDEDGEMFSRADALHHEADIDVLLEAGMAQDPSDRSCARG